MAAERGLINRDLAHLSRQAYRCTASNNLTTKLRAAKPEVNAELLAYYQAVKDLWQAVFQEEKPK